MIGLLSPGAELFCKNHPGILIVVLGVAGEIICEWNREKGIRGLLIKTFGLCLVAGLLLEIWEATKTDALVARVMNDNLKLQTELVSMESKVAEANRQVAESNLKIRKINEVMRFSFKDKGETIKILSQFAGTEAKIEYSEDDLDALSTAQEIESVFKAAGWKTSKEPAHLGPDFIGVIVNNMPHLYEYTSPKTPAGALVGEIKKAGHLTAANNWANEKNVPSETIIVRIPPSWKDPFTIWRAFDALRQLTNRPAQVPPQKP
jgi:hypothetical protein